MDVAASPTEGLSEEARAKFLLLQRRFVMGLPARWRDIAAAGTTASPQDALHRLAGGAGSYGFERLSLLARQAERGVVAGDASALAEALAVLQSEIEATLAGATPKT